MNALFGSAGLPGTMIRDKPLRIEYCPVISAAREGVQAGLDQLLRQAQTLARELVDTRGWGAALLAAAVGTHIAIADVVEKDEHDVGFALGHRGQRRLRSRWR